jgi:hypothetical protein
MGLVQASSYEVTSRRAGDVQHVTRVDDRRIHRRTTDRRQSKSESGRNPGDALPILTVNIAPITVVTWPKKSRR